MENHYAVIMAGGVGSRFWPASTEEQPKQFHDFLGTGRTLLQQTYDRLSKVVPQENIYFVINEKYKDLVMSQIPKTTIRHLIMEPTAMNTAPCIAYASYKIHAKNPKAKLFIAPSDHLIIFQDEFVRIAKIALKEAEKENHLITLGIQPNRPETGFGYIQYEFSEKRVKKVKQFTEKPELKTAREFLRSGDYLWNSGMFIWSTQSIIKSFETLAPSLHTVFSKARNIYFTDQEEKYIKKEYPKVRKDSIDYAIMEKSNHVFVIPSSFGWSDLGTWNSIYDHLEKDENKNAIRGNVLTYNTKDSLIVGNSDKVTVIEGLKDYFIVDTDEVLVICKKENAQDVKLYVNDVRKNFRKKFI
ncbi:MAG: mannose-1-phosphate guanylyltransferase [Flavobacteriales bacterium]